MLVLLLGGQNSEIVLAEIFVSVISTVLDVRHVLHPKLSDRLIGFPNLANLLEDLVPILLSLNHLVEAVGQDIMNRGGRLGGKILKVIRLFVYRNKTGLEVCIDGIRMVPSLQVVHNFELNKSSA
jgi:hypothetical protein